MSEMKVEMGRVYRTRDGRDVRIYAVDGGGSYPVHGARLIDGEWGTGEWTLNGCWIHGEENCEDLVEVRPRIKREFWFNVYPHRIGSPHSSEGYAKAHRGADAIACVRVEIDVEEGHGL